MHICTWCVFSMKMFLSAKKSLGLWHQSKYTLFFFSTHVSMCNILCTYIHMQYTSGDQITEKAPSGCYVSGLYLEGARWDTENSCLVKSHPKVLIEELPILRVIPIEAHRLKLVVSANDAVPVTSIVLWFCIYTFIM